MSMDWSRISRQDGLGLIPDPNRSRDVYKKEYLKYCHREFAQKVKAGYSFECQKQIAYESDNYVETMKLFGMKLVYIVYGGYIFELKNAKIALQKYHDKDVGGTMIKLCTYQIKALEAKVQRVHEAFMKFFRSDN